MPQDYPNGTDAIIRNYSLKLCRDAKVSSVNVGVLFKGNVGVLGPFLFLLLLRHTRHILVFHEISVATTQQSQQTLGINLLNQELEAL